MKMKNQKKLKDHFLAKISKNAFQNGILII